MARLGKPDLHLIHSHNSTEDLLCRANALLGDRDPAQALVLYTKVLYGNGPGHVCALLNRALAYIWLDLPELAVADAYRAGIVANQMRNVSNGISNTRYRSIGRYLRTERLHVKQMSVWTTDGPVCIGQGWLQSPLAKIVIGSDGPLPTNAIDDENRANICRGLEVKAIFRMCAALNSCGGGALTDALALISDALSTCKLLPRERETLDELGDDILRHIEGRMKFESLRAMDETSHPEPESLKAAPSECLSDHMKSKIAMVSREVYHWDGWEPDYTKPDDIKGLQAHVDGLTAGGVRCIGRVKEGRDTWVELRANKDFYPGDRILEERSVYNVTNSDPQSCFEASPEDDTDNYFCESCAAGISLPKEFHNVIKYCVERKIYWAKSFWHKPKYCFTSALDDLENPAVVGTEQVEKASVMSQLSSILNSSQMPDFSFQGYNYIAPYCSAECRTLLPFSLRQLHPPGEHDVRRFTWSNTALPAPNPSLPPPHPLSYHANPITQGLHALLLLRHFAIAFDAQQHPLSLPSFRYLRGRFHSRFSPVTEISTRTLPWSFTANVVRPIYYLHAYHESKGNDPFRFLAHMDGWVINTALAKIEYNTRIQQGAKFRKHYSEYGQVVSVSDHVNECSTQTPQSSSAFGPIMDTGPSSQRSQNDYLGNNGIAATTATVEPAAHGPQITSPHEPARSKPANEQPYTASLHPILSLIRPAIPARGEVSNVSVHYTPNGGVCIYASGSPRHPISPSSPCITNGDILLRPEEPGMRGDWEVEAEEDGATDIVPEEELRGVDKMDESEDMNGNEDVNGGGDTQMLLPTTEQTMPTTTIADPSSHLPKVLPKTLYPITPP